MQNVFGFCYRVRVLPKNRCEQHFRTQQSASEREMISATFRRLLRILLDFIETSVVPSHPKDGLGQDSFDNFREHQEAFRVLEDSTPFLQVTQSGGHWAPIPFPRQIRDQVHCDLAWQKIAVAKRKCIRNKSDTIVGRKYFMIHFHLRNEFSPILFVVEHSIIAILSSIDFDPFHSVGNLEAHCNFKLDY